MENNQNNVIVNGIDYPKMKILSSFTHPQVNPIQLSHLEYAIYIYTPYLKAHNDI